MYYPTAYETTVGRAFQMNKVIRAIEESAIRDGSYHRDFDLIYTEDENKIIPWFIVGSVSSEAQIPFFSHPILVKSQDGKESYLCSDIRPFASYNVNHINNNDAIRIKNRIGLDLERLRLKLNLIWINDRPTILRDFSNIPMIVFSNWIAEAVTRRFGLSPKEQMEIGVIACYYYYSLFSDNKELEDNEKNRLISSILKTTKAPLAIIEETIDKIQYMPSIKELALSIRTVVDNVRLEAFDEGALINLVISSWFGVEARQLVSVSLEHPPTWLSLVYSSFVEKSFKNTVISKITQRYLGPKGENEFVRSLISIAKVG